MNHLPKLRVVTCSNSSETMFWCLDQVAADPRSTLLICPSEDIATRIRRYYKHSALNGNEESLIGWDTMVRSISTESARPKRSPIRAVQKRILQRLVNTELTSESYIKGLPWSPGLNSALLDLILELKANGVLPEYLNDTALEHRLDLDNPLLVKEISTLLSAYNSYLLAHGLYDSTEFLKRALSTNNDPVEFPLNGKLMIFCGHFSYDFEFC